MTFNINKNKLKYHYFIKYFTRDLIKHIHENLTKHHIELKQTLKQITDKCEYKKTGYFDPSFFNEEIHNKKVIHKFRKELN